MEKLRKSWGFCCNFRCFVVFYSIDCKLWIGVTYCFVKSNFKGIEVASTTRSYKKMRGGAQSARALNTFYPSFYGGQNTTHLRIYIR